MHHRKLILLIVIASIIHTKAVRVDTKAESTTKKSESAGDPKAEALTLVIHNFPPSKLPAKLRPVKVIDRNDDVVVIHSSRPKRKPSTRKRRPSNQFRSKIKYSSPGSSSSFGGFKDFSSSDFRFPPFPTKTFGEPPRASNKYKHGSSRPSYNLNAQASQTKSRRPTTLYGPPPTFNQFEFDHESPFDGKPLQTLQQQVNNFPSYAVDTVEPSNSYFGGSSNKFPHPINNFPLESGSSFNSQKTSYGSPVRGQSSSNNFQFNPNIVQTTLNTTPRPVPNPNYANFNLHPGSTSDFSASSNPNFNLNSNFNGNFPKLPSRYEPKDFSTPTRTNPLGGNNQFLNEYNNYNDASESQNVPTTTINKNRFKSFNKFKNYDYDFGKHKNSAPDEDEDEEDEYVFSTRRPIFTTTTTTTTEPPPPPSTTKRPKKNQYGKRKRPQKISQSHVLDTDDLRDAFTESTDFHEVSLNSEDFIAFDSQRKKQRKNNRPKYPHEIPSTLRKVSSQDEALRTALGDDYQILSIEKSHEKDPNDQDFGFNRKSDDSFLVGSDIRFSSVAAAPVLWSGDFKNFPQNHRFS